MKHRAAFTLLEMIVVLAIAALVIGIGAGTVQQLAAEHELLKVAHDAERVLMQAMSSTRVQQVALDSLSQHTKLTVRHPGSAVFAPTTNQHLHLRPGGLCEPLTLRWQTGARWVSATLDPLTAGFTELEENP